MAWLAAVCLLQCEWCRAQTESAPPSWITDTWQMEEGLPENIVNAVAQTPDGYLWCGTTRGLARFDGVSFKVFNGANTPALGAARIRQLLVDRQGMLWITTSDGRLIRQQSGQFTAFNPPPRESASRIIIRLSDDATGALWLTAEDGALLRFDEGKFTLPSAKWDPSGRQIFHVHSDFQGRPWVASRTSLSQVNTDNGDLVPALTGKAGQYTVLAASRTGGWWIQTANRIKLWRDGQWLADAGAIQWPTDRPPPSCLEDRTGCLWLGLLGDGLFRYSTNAPPQRITTAEGLGSDLIRCVFEDAEGNVWVGTRAGGLNRVRPRLFQTIARKNGLAADQITAVCAGAAGELWVGTDGEGLNRIKDGVITQFSREQGLDGRHVRALAYDRRGDLWVGTWPGGLFKLEGNRFTAVKNLSGPRFAIASLFQDSHDNLWLGQRALNQLLHLTNGVPAAPVTLPNTAPSMDVVAFAEDAAGNLWIGTDGSGIFRWRDGQCRRYNRTDGLPNNNIRSLFADTDGALWIGTMDGGLCRLKENKIVTCTTKDGLIDNVINHITDDGRGHFWFSSFGGIFRADKAVLNEFADGKRKRIQCIAYGKSDGVTTLECQGGFQPAGARTSDGRLWFPTIKGLVSIDPASVTTRSYTPTVVIEELLVNNQPFVEDGSDGADGTNRILEIPAGQHRIDFHYTGFDFAAPERVRFRTKLEGIDPDWIEAGEQRQVSYSTLPPGKYQFRVTAYNQAGLWNESGATLMFRVLPQFWQTWWFTTGTTALGAVGLTALIFHTARRRYKHRLARLEMQLSVERERARIARDIHDGVGANLTEIAWLAEVAEHDAAKPDEVRTQVRKISGTARETVQLFDEIVWAVLPQNDTLTGLIEYLGRRVDEWFENSSVRCWFTAPRELPDCVVPAEVRHGVFLACKEALHNVNKHAQATEVRVQVTAIDSTLRISITDNGRGFDTRATARGNGLRNLRKRFEELGGSFELNSQPGHGTQIQMVIQLNPVPHKP